MIFTARLHHLASSGLTARTHHGPKPSTDQLDEAHAPSLMMRTDEMILIESIDLPLRRLLGKTRNILRVVELYLDRASSIGAVQTRLPQVSDTRRLFTDVGHLMNHRKERISLQPRMVCLISKLQYNVSNERRREFHPKGGPWSCDYPYFVFKTQMFLLSSGDAFGVCI